MSDIAESLRACTENGADPEVLFVAADEIDKLRADNARQAERIKANEQYEQALKDDCRKQVADLRAAIAAQAAEIERERTARKTAQESLERYKGECTRLQHEVDRLKGEGAVDHSERA